VKYRELDIALVVSQPDRAVGRKQELVYTPVKQVALDNGIEVIQPESLKRDRSLETGLRLLDLDFIVVVAYGKIIPKTILNIPKYGCINLHGSILPSYR
jgi:methionyl-tRNA formyltransferase